MSDDLDKLLNPPNIPPGQRRWKGRIDITIHRNGEWSYGGTPIARREMVALFARQLLVKDGHYYLDAPEQLLRIEVEDLPFTIVGLQVEGEGYKQLLEVVTNCDERIAIGAEHPLVLLPMPGVADKGSMGSAKEESLPAVLVRDGLYARFSRNCYYQLASLANEIEVDNERTMQVCSGGIFFSIGAC
ncbi:MAG: DUF1285 domain-containing protein [Pseudomonadales bacterium]